MFKVARARLNPLAHGWGKPALLAHALWWGACALSAGWLLAQLTPSAPLARQPLWGQDGQLPRAAGQLAAMQVFGTVPRQAETAAPPAGNLRLIGLWAPLSGQTGVALLAEGAATHVLRQGASLANGWQLLRVEARRVVLGQSGREQVLELAAPLPPAAVTPNPPPAAPNPAPESSPIDK